MLLGALLELGAPVTKVRSQLARLGIASLRMRTSKVERGGIAASYVSFSGESERPHARHYKEIRDVVASAGLDALTDGERAHFSELNTDYTTRFGFPFIIAVKGLTKDQILQHFHERLGNDLETEFETACQQVEQIARIRIADIIR